MKIAFLVVFTAVHAFVACASGLLSFMTVFSMCGPGRPATVLTYISGGLSLVLFCPFALPSFWLGILLNQNWVMLAGVL